MKPKQKLAHTMKILSYANTCIYGTIQIQYTYRSIWYNIQFIRYAVRVIFALAKDRSR